MTAKFTVGQKLWYVASGFDDDHGYELTVEKVGRKWIMLEGGLRMSSATMHIHFADYATSRRCYFSCEEWESDKALKAAWRSLCDQISRSPRSAFVSLADIKAAAAKVGLKIED